MAAGRADMGGREGGRSLGREKGEGGRRDLCSGDASAGCELNQRNARHVVVELPQQPPEDTTVWEGADDACLPWDWPYKVALAL